MWGVASNTLSGSIGLNNGSMKQNQVSVDGSDDDTCLNKGSEDGLDCPICWESFNIVENVPYVLWCGHTLCKNCVMGLQRAIVKLPTFPMQLPFFISCPWCNLFCLRLVYKGNVKYPCKNYFLLWMVESMNGDRSKSRFPYHGNHSSTERNQVSRSTSHHPGGRESNHHRGHAISHYMRAGRRRVLISVWNSLVFVMHLMAKFPLIIIFLLIILYAIPASAIILALYVLITLVFAVPSFLVLYCALPGLDWLMREIVS